jgi:hypothetical protein
MYSNSLFPIITKPTRITRNSSTLIDNIFTNDLYKIHTLSGILFTDISNHFPVSTILNDNKLKNVKPVIRKRIVSQEGIGKFSEMLETINWDEICNNENGSHAMPSHYSTNLFVTYMINAFLFEPFKVNIATKNYGSPKVLGTPYKLRTNCT